MSRKPPADQDRDPERQAQEAEFDARGQAALLQIMENAGIALGGLSDLLTGHIELVVLREGPAVSVRCRPNLSRDSDGWEV